MKNKEKYAKEIIEIACSGNIIAVSKATGKPIACKKISCEDCNHYNNLPICVEKSFRTWAESEYIEKPVISKRDRAFWIFSWESMNILQETRQVIYMYTARSQTNVIFFGQEIVVNILALIIVLKLTFQWLNGQIPSRGLSRI